MRLSSETCTAWAHPDQENEQQLEQLDGSRSNAKSWRSSLTRQPSEMCTARAHSSQEKEQQLEQLNLRARMYAISVHHSAIHATHAPPGRTQTRRMSSSLSSWKLKRLMSCTILSCLNLATATQRCFSLAACHSQITHGRRCSISPHRRACSRLNAAPGAGALDTIHWGIFMWARCTACSNSSTCPATRCYND